MKRYLYIISSLLFILSACHSFKKEPATDPAKTAANYKLIAELKPVIQPGDMIFRSGMDEVSHAARSFNRKDTSYSHCGLLFIENDTIFVYHALGGIYNPSQKLMRQPLDSFCNPAENNAVAVYRYPLTSPQINKLEETVQRYFNAGVKFDLYFNYQSDDRLYCAEFVFKSLNRAVDSTLTSYIRTDTIPYGVTTDDLFLHPRSRLIRKENFIY